MTRTASHNSVLSLSACISAALTVLSMRTVAPLSSLFCWALTNNARLTARQVQPLATAATTRSGKSRE